MTKDPDSAECPVCGHTVPSDAASCPSCGADLSMSSLDELEKVAKSISSGEPLPTREEKKAETRPAPPPVETKKEQAVEPEKPKPSERAEEPGKKENRIGKLFGKRKK
ncbi:MAG TPA: zinc ribbon domain-containing protein [Methanomassiliicoccales archaeon]|nr:zinc ribbon domain-containing protein [Methanomassiliicoccales archaeon]